MLLLCICIFAPQNGQVIPVEVVADSNGAYTLVRGGEAYYIKGAGGTNKDLFDELVARGGNSIRTWGIDGLTLSMMNKAHDKGLSVMLGLWMSKEKDGFDYNNQAKVDEQLEKFRNLVRQFRNHPALLAWSIGNELDLSYTNLKVWNAVNDISLMIHEEDGNHPTLTITAGISLSKANAIAQRAPDLDMLGINTYGSISGVHSTLLASEWNKPYLITEWGVNGPWEVGKTPWGAPYEPSSTEKAAVFLNRYQNNIHPYKSLLPGSYAFYWNSKFEATYTWFGLWVGMATTEMIDVLEYSWTGIWPDNRAPGVESVTINGLGQKSNLRLSSHINNRVEVIATDPEGDTLDYEFLVLPESGDYLTEAMQGATYRCIPGVVTKEEGGSALLTFDEIHNHLNLRLYVLIRDGHGHIATATFPFQTGFLDLSSSPDENGQNQPGISIWPNPAVDWLYIQADNEMIYPSIIIYNCFGQEVFSQTFKKISGMVTVSLDGVPDGIYLLKVAERGEQEFLIPVIIN